MGTLNELDTQQRCKSMKSLGQSSLKNVRRNILRGPLVCCLTVLFSFPGAALYSQTPDNDRVRENETEQRELQVQAQGLIAEWSAMIADYERNGIADDDVKPVKNLLGLMSKLNDADMKKVIELLQQARATKDPKAALQQVAEAYSGQKTISLTFKRALAEFQRKQDAREIAAALEGFGAKAERHGRKCRDAGQAEERFESGPGCGHGQGLDGCAGKRGSCDQ